MKFVRIELDGRPVSGVVEEDRIIPIKGSILGKYEKTDRSVPLADAKFLPPVEPSKVVCVGQNYRGHIAELGVPVPKEPVVFLKPPSCLIGHGEGIVYPEDAERVDYEGEMGLVIKGVMKNVPEAQTLDHVLGVTCCNDVTERALVFRDHFLINVSKGYDTFGPLGPYVVTGLDPDNLDVKTYLNGKVVQEDNTKECVFKVPFLLHYISRIMTLYPGDVVITGTPKGIAPMQVGDVVEVEVEGVGKLTNPIVEP